MYKFSTWALITSKLYIQPVQVLQTLIVDYLATKYTKIHAHGLQQFPHNMKNMKKGKDAFSGVKKWHLYNKVTFISFLASNEFF